MVVCYDFLIMQIKKEITLILSDQEIKDIKDAIYIAMKKLDESKEGTADKKLSDRLEIIYEAL